MQLIMATLAECNKVIRIIASSIGTKFNVVNMKPTVFFLAFAFLAVVAIAA
jgi:hypothetical protein